MLNIKKIMDKIVFDEEQKSLSSIRVPMRQYRGLIGLLIRWKIAKNEVQANLILIGAIIVILIITIFIFVTA